MKRISIGFLITFMLLIIISACKEDKWMDWKLANDQWYANHKNDPGFITTSSGLCYKVIHQGYQRRPNINSVVFVKYKGSLIDGSVFQAVDTTTAVLTLATAILGWQEGIQKMNGGGSYDFYIPSKLGYDTISTNLTIPPHSVLIFHVDLIDSQY